VRFQDITLTSALWGVALEVASLDQSRSPGFDAEKA
jgi:hypothetical protein